MLGIQILAIDLAEICSASFTISNSEKSSDIAAIFAGRAMPKLNSINFLKSQRS